MMDVCVNKVIASHDTSTPFSSSCNLNKLFSLVDMVD